MGKDEKRKYKQWQEKYKTAQIRLDKQEKANENPAKKIFNMKEAQMLQEGNYHEEIEEMEKDEKGPGPVDKVNKTVFVGERDNLHDELNIMQYEDAIKDVINNEQQLYRQKNDGDCIPDHLRKELGLPVATDMEGY